MNVLSHAAIIYAKGKKSIMVANVK